MCLNMRIDIVKINVDIDMETWKVLLAEALTSTWDFDQEYQKELMRLSNVCMLSLGLQQASFLLLKCRWVHLPTTFS